MKIIIECPEEITSLDWGYLYQAFKELKDLPIRHGVVSYEFSDGASLAVYFKRNKASIKLRAEKEVAQ